MAIVLLALFGVACTKPADSSNLRKRNSNGSNPGPRTGETTDGPRPTYRSGTRIRAKVYQTEDGAKAWHGWHDSQLDAECTFATSEDSLLRCLPHADNYVYFYLDAACKAPVYVHREKCNVPKYVALNEGCANIIFQPAEQTGVGKVYRNEGGNCVQNEVPEGTLYTLVHQTADLFVPAAEVVEARGALEARYLEAEDGALQLMGAYDPSRNTACSPRSPDYADRCAPDPATALPQIAVRYADNACSKPAVGVNIQCGLPASTSAAVLMPETLCGSPALVSLEGAHTGAVSLKSDTGCDAAPEEPAVRYYEIGPQIVADTLPKVGFADEGSGRIRTRYVTTESGEKVGLVGFVDSTDGQECYPIQTASGLRCIPKVGAHALFGDTNCQKPLAEVFRGGDCGSAPAPKGVLSRTDGECNATTFRYFKVGAEAKPTDLFLSAGAKCEQATIDMTGTAFYETTEVPPTDFVAVTDTTE